MSELLVDLDEAGRRLGGVSRRLVQQLVYDGELPSVTCRKRRLIAVADLEAYVDRLREENKNEREAWKPALVRGGSRDAGRRT